MRKKFAELNFARPKSRLFARKSDDEPAFEWISKTPVTYNRADRDALHVELGREGENVVIDTPRTPQASHGVLQRARNLLAAKYVEPIRVHIADQEKQVREYCDGYTANYAEWMFNTSIPALGAVLEIRDCATLANLLSLHPHEDCEEKDKEDKIQYAFKRMTADFGAAERAIDWIASVYDLEHQASGEMLKEEMAEIIRPYVREALDTVLQARTMRSLWQYSVRNPYFQKLVEKDYTVSNAGIGTILTRLMEQMGRDIVDPVAMVELLSELSNGGAAPGARFRRVIYSRRPTKNRLIGAYSVARTKRQRDWMKWGLTRAMQECEQVAEKNFPDFFDAAAELAANAFQFGWNGRSYPDGQYMGKDSSGYSFPLGALQVMDGPTGNYHNPHTASLDWLLARDATLGSVSYLHRVTEFWLLQRMPEILSEFLRRRHAKHGKGNSLGDMMGPNFEIGRQHRAMAGMGQEGEGFTRRKVTLKPGENQTMPHDERNWLKTFNDFSQETGQSHGRWGAMTMLRPHLGNHIKPAAATSRHFTATEEGSHFRYPERYVSDGHVFSRKVKRNCGTILMDVSGSMDYEREDIRRFSEECPNVTMAAYGSDSAVRGGFLKIIAQDGRVADEETIMNHFGGGNLVDGPALYWLADQKGPRIWVSDGMVTGRGEDSEDVLNRECDAVVMRARITHVRCWDDALALLGVPEYTHRLPVLQHRSHGDSPGAGRPLLRPVAS
jgi:hypothetical protein